MSITARPFEQGKLTVISGPVQSEKTQELEGFLDALRDSRFRQRGNAVLARHPRDDSDPERIGQHDAHVTDKVDEIYNAIEPQTGTIIIAGASHYRDSRLITLIDSALRSNRQVIASGLNLDSKGKPYGLMPQLMALADEVILSKAICGSYPVCSNTEANRSFKDDNGDYVARCAYHYSNPNETNGKNITQGRLGLDVGSVRSGKTKYFARSVSKIRKVNWPHVLFKWTNDARYGEKIRDVFEEGTIASHDETTIHSAIAVRNAKDMENYLRDRPEIKKVFFDEAHFIEGIYDLVFRLLPEGYDFQGTALPRAFNRQKFNDVPALMCLADKIHTNQAICVTHFCGRPATDNQRMKRKEEGADPEPAHADDPLVLVGGKDQEGAMYYYEPRCLRHWQLKGEHDPNLEYKLTPFTW